MTTAAIARALGISPQSTMGYGYSGQRATLVEMGNRWDWRVLHDEMQRRHLALYFSHPGTVRIGIDADGLAILRTPMGSGSAGRAAGAHAVAAFWARWSRTYLPNRPTRMTPEGRAWLKPGMAPIAYPGTSNHEADTWENRAMAVDNIGWEDGWMGRIVHLFGLKTFWNVGNEPWHTQPAGMGNSKSDLQADLRARGLPPFSLPAIPLAATTEPSEEDDDMETIDPGRWLDNEVLEAGQIREFDAPFGALAFAGSVTTVGATSPGFVTMWGNGTRPLVSTCRIHPDGNDNYASVKAGTDGKVRIYASQSCRIFFDLQAIQR